jgi:hypothetical protein
MHKFLEVESITENCNIYWQPEEKLITEDITIGKMYKLHVSKLDGEICIYDDVGMDSMSWMWNTGKLYKLEEEKDLKNNNIILKGGRISCMIQTLMTWLKQFTRLR